MPLSDFLFRGIGCSGDVSILSAAYGADSGIVRPFYRISIFTSEMNIETEVSDWARFSVLYSLFQAMMAIGKYERRSSRFLCYFFNENSSFEFSFTNKNTKLVFELYIYLNRRILAVKENKFFLEHFLGFGLNEKIYPFKFSEWAEPIFNLNHWIVLEYKLHFQILEMSNCVKEADSFALKYSN